MLRWLALGLGIGVGLVLARYVLPRGLSALARRYPAADGIDGLIGQPVYKDDMKAFDPSLREASQKRRDIAARYVSRANKVVTKEPVSTLLRQVK